MDHEDIFVALGTNIGNKRENLEKALQLMNTRGIAIVKTSSWYRTKPYGYEDQDYFLNGVAKVTFPGEPDQLLKELQQIETDMGRVRKIHWGPRIIDLDIILFGQRIIKETNLIIPHPDMQNREFVLEPLIEIAADAVHPVFQKAAIELFNRISK